jgi:hypothetical protein
MVGSKVARREQSGDVRLRARLPPEFADPNPSKPHHSHDCHFLVLLRLIAYLMSISTVSKGKGLISHPLLSHPRGHVNRGISLQHSRSNTANHITPNQRISLRMLVQTLTPHIRC